MRGEFGATSMQSEIEHPTETTVLFVFTVYTVENNMYNRVGVQGLGTLSLGIKKSEV